MDLVLCVYLFDCGGVGMLHSMLRFV
jgi:hypothetical protein